MSRETNGLDVFSSGRSSRHLGRSCDSKLLGPGVCDVRPNWLADSSGEVPCRHGPGAGDKGRDSIPRLQDTGTLRLLLTLTMHRWKTPKIAHRLLANPRATHNSFVMRDELINIEVRTTTYLVLITEHVDM